MRRVFLLVVGLCGSLLVVCLLVRSAEGIIGENYATEVALYNVNEQEGTRFPIAVTNTCLIAQYPVLYEGAYLENGSNEYVVDVAAIVLFNTAHTGIEEVCVTLEWAGGEYVFDAQMLPPREAVIVLERSRKKYDNHQWTACYGSQKMGEGEWITDKQLVVGEADDISISLKNISDVKLRDIRIYYKSYLPQDQLYLGGITYCTGLDELNAGERATIRPFRYVSGYSKIVRIEYCG